MGLFDKILGGSENENLTLNEQESFAAILLTVMGADGSASEEEMMTFGTMIGKMTLFKSQSEKEFKEMLKRLGGIARRRGEEFLLTKALESLPPHLYDTVFANATDMILADGAVESEEKEILYKIKNALKIPDAQAVKIVEVMRIKNRG